MKSSDWIRALFGVGQFKSVNVTKNAYGDTVDGDFNQLDVPQTGKTVIWTGW
jgi:hypothetical protein